MRLLRSFWSTSPSCHRRRAGGRRKDRRGRTSGRRRSTFERRLRAASVAASKERESAAGCPRQSAPYAPPLSAPPTDTTDRRARSACMRLESAREGTCCPNRRTMRINFGLLNASMYYRSTTIMMMTTTTTITTDSHNVVKRRVVSFVNVRSLRISLCAISRASHSVY